MNPEKARLFYTKKKKLSDFKKIPEVEEVFLADNNFFPKTKLQLLNPWRHFYLSTDGRFYFSPDWFSQNVYRIYDCSKIKNVELFEAGSSSAALDGALLFGAAGAVVGASSKETNYCFKVTMNDPETPVMFALIGIQPVHGNTQEYRQVLTIAEKVITILKQYIKSEEPQPDPAQPSINSDFMDALRELAAMKKDGLLTDEEFNAAKSKLLG